MVTVGPADADQVIPQVSIAAHTSLVPFVTTWPPKPFESGGPPRSNTSHFCPWQEIRLNRSVCLTLLKHPPCVSLLGSHASNTVEWNQGMGPLPVRQRGVFSEGLHP